MIKLCFYFLLSLSCITSADVRALNTVKTVGDLLQDKNSFKNDKKTLWLGVSKYNAEQGIRFYLTSKNHHSFISVGGQNERYLGPLILQFNHDKKPAFELIERAYSEEQIEKANKNGYPLYICDIPSNILKNLTSIDVLSANKKVKLASYSISKQIKLAPLESVLYWLAIEVKNKLKSQREPTLKEIYKLEKNDYFSRASPLTLHTSSNHYIIDPKLTKQALPRLIPDECTLKATYHAKTNSIQLSSTKLITTKFTKEHLLLKITINGVHITAPLHQSKVLMNMFDKWHKSPQKLNAELYLTALKGFSPKSGDTITIEILLTPLINHFSGLETFHEYSSNKKVHRANVVSFKWP